MIKKNIKSKSIFKGAVFGIALVMCGSFVPVGAIQTLATTWTETNSEKQVSANTNRIEVDASTSKTVVEKGSEITIPTGSYFGKSDSAHVIGSGVAGTITESKVVAYYKADEEVVYDSSNKETYQEAKFEANRIGTYVVEYIVVDNGVKYSHSLEFNCVVNEVSFNFATNSDKIIPSVYDLGILGDNLKDIVLPIPTMKDEDGEVIENVKVFLDGEETGDEQQYLQISLDHAYSKEVKIEKDSDGNLFIDGDSLKDANGYEFKVIYKFYQNGVQIASNDDNVFKVDNDYYTDANGDSGYTLTIDLASSKPASAVVGVELELPSINATTSAKDSPASETVAVSYRIEVNKRVDGVWQKVEGLLDEDNNFKAKEAGDYQFVYYATDFYGKEAKYSFTITGVKDTVSATPYIYDAGNSNAKNEDGSYASAENLLKSQTVNRNIIMYAIGGSDNAVAEEDITLTRTIKSSSGSIIYKISDYNNKNLILQPKKDGDKGLYTTIYDDNYQIRRQMILSGVTGNDEETIKSWLLSHNYLIVVNDKVTSPTGENFKEDGSEMTQEELLAQGFVYIEPNTSNATLTEQTYSFYYSANDNVEGNNAKEIYFNVEVKESVDDAKTPSILYSTELKSSYLSDDIINLTAPTASDEGGDSRVEVVTAYRYLDSSRNPITESGEEIKYLINDASKVGISSSKWYIQAGENNIVTSSGWTILEGESEYQIKLKTKPTNAAYIEFFSYAIDDQGNVGFYNKQVFVSNIEDTKAPSLYQVVTPDVEGGYVNNQTIVLPTLYFEDNLPQYMNAGVVVYKVEGNEQIVVHSSNMSTYYDSYAGTFVLEAGTFNATTGGDYLVAVTVTDAGKHSITTYFSYDVYEKPVVQDPEITNISTENKEIVIGEEQSLVTPKLTVSNSDEVAYIGLSEYDSETTANYYTVSVVSADNNDYKLTENKFVANSRGTYKLQYNVFVISYSTNAEYFSATGTENGKLFLTTNATTGMQMLAYKANEGDTCVGEETASAGEVFYVFLQKDAETGKFVLRVNTDVKGLGKELNFEELPTYQENESVVELHEMTSDIITYTAGEVAVNLNMDASAYEKTKYEDLTQSIEIKPIDAEVSGSGEIDKDNSKVEISVSTGSSTRTIASVSINGWNNVTETNDIKSENGKLILNLNTNGKYTIKYTVKAKDKYGMSVGSEKTISYEISVGDVIAPEIEIDNENNQFVKTTYEVGDKIDFKYNLINVSDEVTSEEDLIESLVIVVKNTSTNKSETLGINQSYEIKEEGNYTVSVYVKDNAGNKSETKEFTFTVGGDESTPINVTEVIGKVLIGASIVLLGGIVVYFIVSKVNENKKRR